MKNLSSTLFLNDLSLQVHLGWSEAERQTPQTVSLTIRMQFATLPKACSSDALADTICYATLVATLTQHLHTKSFKLIEHLAQEIYSLLRTQLPAETALKIHLVKQPPISNLKGGVCFELGDC